ncbi:GNAT family N-acetyltransferase [Sphingomonas hankyongi]|uniref:GNAT family N-acetyltransferase n=1 Tax=Sphingomonas hankyongi TaxID=2908209 RepID=A0ABT0S1U7_9SPHN|nr:GNAT family N-acetyltransferase [Sphingomonas hankyongi]MCL6729634.1 GNAT family N-acetyltransferase [Sphingomonas hankyongi]
MATPALSTVVQLEPGSSRDLEAVMEIMEAAFGSKYGEAWTRSQCAGILPMAGVWLQLAREQHTGNVVGFSLSRCVAGEAELLLLGVLPSRHRQGIGRQLLDHFTRRAAADGASRVHLEVRDGNPAVHMYRAAGFEPVGRRRKYYHAPDGQNFDALTFARTV